MATVKFPSEMAPATSIGGNDKLMISKEATGEAYQATFNQAKEYLNITGIELEPLVGGDTSGTALLVAPGPSGEQRTAEVASGKYYDFGSGAVLADADKRWKAYWSGSSWSLKDMGALPTPDTSQLLAKDEVETTGGTLDYSAYTVEGMGYDGTGAEVVSSTSAIVKNMPIDASKGTIYLDNTYADSLMKYFFRNLSGDIVGTVGSNNNTRMAIPIPAGAVNFSFTLYRASGPLKPNFYVAYQTIDNNYVNGIMGAGIEASKLSDNNKTPAPVNPDNAVNLSHFNANAIRNSDLVTQNVESKVNLLNMDFRVLGKSINSDGSIASDTSGTPNHIIQNHPIGEMAGKTITVSGIGANTLKKLVLRDADGLPILPVWGLSPIPRSFAVPEGTVTFDLSLKRGTELESNYQYAMINIGTSALPYEPHYALAIKTIKGYPIAGTGGGGGEEYDQSLNTSDNVEFGSVRTGLLEMTAWEVDIPQGAGSPPPEVLVGHAWLDTNTDTIKVRRS